MRRATWRPPQAPAGAGAAGDRRLLLPRGHRGRGRVRQARGLCAVVADAGRRDAHRARAQPVAAAARGRAPGDLDRRPPVPGLGGRAAVPRRLPRPGRARRPRGAGATDRGLGGGPPAVPPRDPRPVAGGAASRAGRTGIERPPAPRIPRPERDGRPAGRAPGVPARHLRPRASVGDPVRPDPRDRGKSRPPRRAGAARRLHRPDRGRHRGLPVPRGPPPAPRPDAGRGVSARRRQGSGTAAPAGSSRTTGPMPRRCVPTPARRTGPPSGGCWAAKASSSRRVARAAGSRSCRPPSSATTRGSRWRPRGGRGTTAGGRRRSRPMRTRRQASGWRDRPRHRGPSGSGSRPGWIPRRSRRPTPRARCVPGSCEIRGTRRASWPAARTRRRRSPAACCSWRRAR